MEAKEVLSKMLVPAQDRWTPDAIANLPFFCEGAYVECATCSSVENQHQRHRSDVDRSIYEQYCQRVGVGNKANGDQWPCVEEEEPLNPIRKGKGLYALPWEWSC